MTLPKQTKEIKKDQALKLPVFDDEQVQELFKARCKDLKIPVKLKQLGKFADICSEKCLNRKINLENMFVGPVTAQLLANWIIQGLIDITHLLLAQNNLGDAGLLKLAPALAFNKAIVQVDLQ